LLGGIAISEVEIEIPINFELSKVEIDLIGVLIEIPTILISVEINFAVKSYNFAKDESS
jgi:hypothetical protein